MMQHPLETVEKPVIARAFMPVAIPIDIRDISVLFGRLLRQLRLLAMTCFFLS